MGLCPIEEEGLQHHICRPTSANPKLSRGQRGDVIILNWHSLHSIALERSRLGAY
jgi:hypothetical protein